MYRMSFKYEIRRESDVESEYKKMYFKFLELG